MEIDQTRYPNMPWRANQTDGRCDLVRGTMDAMSRQGCGNAIAGVFGLIAGLLLWGLVLGLQLHRHEQGLWTVRFQRILDCGLDYSAPPYTSGSVNVWLTCGDEDRSWRLWPPGRE